MARTLILALLLAGCATTTEVRVPVPVPCVDRDAVPTEPKYTLDSLPADVSAAEIVRAAGIDLLAAMNYAFQLRALVGACTHDGSQAPDR